MNDKTSRCLLHGCATFAGLLLIFCTSVCGDDEPQFLHQNSTTIIKEFVGGTVKMDCRTADTHPRPTIRWYKYGHPLEDITYRPVIIKPDPTTWILELTNLLLADSGKYRCSVGYHGNSSGSVDRTFTLHVQEFHKNRPTILGAASVNISAEVGSTVKLVCHANSTSVPYIIWRKTIIYPSRTANTNISKKSNTSSVVSETQSEVIELITDETALRMRAYKEQLVLRSASLEDSAKYTCLVFNQRGRVTKDFYMKVVPERRPSVRELQFMYGRRFGRATQLPLAAMMCIPVVILVLVAAVLLRALEKAKRKYVEREANAVVGRESALPLSLMNSADHICTNVKQGHSEVSPPRPRRLRVCIAAETTYQVIPCDDEPSELPSVDEPSIPVPLLEEPMNPPADTPDRDTNNVPCDAFEELSLEKEPLLSLEALLNNVPHLQEGPLFCSLSESDQPSSYRASLAGDLELEWEGMDLTVLTDLEESVQLSKEADV